MPVSTRNISYTNNSIAALVQTNVKITKLRYFSQKIKETQNVMLKLPCPIKAYTFPKAKPH